ncbi:peptidoglycan recognition family protein [Pseudoxanthomonas winnipegensis]|jgi:hypothetical protein|uniref:N-acetylmuramoyl-L-alanine amidase n=1 Tax=Pseudoxanthomonas winnipegensis TaxID=2480810 RepID=A0A4Q8LAW0_9GAMM|nr:peptidoglycan recognition family protein [Pseudoxanthomonas winnipegensis]TAA25793.1 N-acetylmuramoyl-L-alanine amidase [Pseudoxanthomonas winnipegensis]
MADPNRMPSDPSHPDHALYQQLLRGVEGLHRWQGDQNANVAAALYAQVKADPRFPEQISQVVLGDPSAKVPSVFATYTPPYGADPMRASAPTSSAQTPAADSLRPFALPASQVDKDGMLTAPEIRNARVTALEHGALTSPEAIVMHRTESSTAKSTLDGYNAGGQPAGAHFLIDKDGTIYQTASLDHQTWHVGKIRSRGAEEGTLIEPDKTWHAQTGFKPTAINSHENANPYPIRYPNNSDSIGIEVVGAYNATTKTWDAPTAEQTASIHRLVGVLQQQYGLDNHDIYKHDTISYKTAGEGDGLYVPGAAAAGGVQQPAGPTR